MGSGPVRVSKISQICRISIAFALWEAQITNISPEKNAQKFELPKGGQKSHVLR
jgi:hypothetical protein